MAEINDPFANTASVPAEPGRRIVSIALALNLIAVVTAYAAYADWVSRRSLVLLLVVFPWITLLLVRIFRPALYLNRELKMTNVTLAVVGPGLALLYLSLSDSTPIHWLKPTILTILGAVSLIMGVVFANPAAKPRGHALVVLAALCCAYGYGAGLQINALFDSGIAKSYPIRVLSTRSTAFARFLTVEPWGPKKWENNIMVRGSLYSHVHAGNVVCVHLHPGALGMAWYAVSSCSGG
jgi:hypothetical protein